VIFNADLRRRVEETVQAIRTMLTTPVLPPPVNDKRCEHCSLRESCMPSVIGEQRRTKSLLRGLFSVQEA